MNLNAKTIKEELLKIFKDAKYEQYSTPYDIWRELKMLIERNGYDTHNISFNVEKHTLKVSYKLEYLLQITINRQMGAYHHTWFGNYHDWTIKDLTVNILNNNFKEDFTIDDRMLEINKKLEKIEIAKDEQKQKMNSIVDRLKESGMTSQDIRAFCEYVVKNKWSMDSLRD